MFFLLTAQILYKVLQILNFNMVNIHFTNFSTDDFVSKGAKKKYETIY